MYIDDSRQVLVHDRHLHRPPRGYLSNPECFDDDDDEMGHLCTLGLDDSRTLAHDMVDS